jgi:hypothetical protein
MRIPKSMQTWVKEQFGSVTSISRQNIVKVTNILTYEEALFNRLRSSRPIDFRESNSMDGRYIKTVQDDVFCSPKDTTPEDTFGRVTGKHCMTASNIAKYDGLHGVVIFREYNPLVFTREQIIDYLDTAWRWAEMAHNEKTEAKYFFFCWNCLWRGGASVYHGHAQVMLTTGQHYAKIEKMRQIAEMYRNDYHTNYFNDLFQVHYSLGCALGKKGVKVIAYLTPFRDNEVMLVADGINLSLKERIYEVLACMRDKLGVTSFNLGLVTPPLAETEEDWTDFPVLVWVVDRGDSTSQASDIGSIEIFASSVISSDPFQLIQQLRKCM